MAFSPEILLSCESIITQGLFTELTCETVGKGNIGQGTGKRQVWDIDASGFTGYDRAVRGW